MPIISKVISPSVQKTAIVKTNDAFWAMVSVSKLSKYRETVSGFLLCLAVTLASQFANAQSQVGVIGVPPDATMYPIPGLGFVNLNNGNLHFEFPLWTAKDRNGKSVTHSLVYDNSTFTIVQVPVEGGSGTYSAWAAFPGINPGGQSSAINEWLSGLRLAVSPNQSGQATWNGAYTTLCHSQGNCSSGYIYSNFQYVDGNGAVHPITPTLSTGDPSLSSYGYGTTIQSGTTDGSGYWFEVVNETTVTVYDVHGNIVYSGNGAIDTNGNIAKQGYDSLGRFQNLLPTGFSITTKSIYVWTDFGSTPEEIGSLSQGSGTTTTGAVQETVIDTLTLPGGRKYTFQYDDAGVGQGPNGTYLASQQGHYGSLTGITLPTDGQITLMSEVGSNPQNFYVIKSIQTPDGTWNFSYPSVTTMIATAPPVSPAMTGSDTKCVCSSGGTTQTISVYPGSYTGNNALRTTVVQYSSPGQPSKITTTLDDGTTSSYVTYAYADSCTHRVTAKKEYDFSGNLFRETDVGYKTSTSDNTALCSVSGVAPSWTDTYLQGSHHIVDIPTSVTTFGSSGSAIAETAYTYDSTGLTATSGTGGASVLGLSVHDDTDFGASMTVRGNPTVIQQLTTSGTMQTTATNTYNILGELVETDDGNGNKTQFDYSDNWNTATTSCFSSSVFAYITKITNAASQATTKSYNSCDGTVASVQDPNDIHNSRTGTSTTYDGLQRVTSISYPDGGSTSYSYGGSTTPEAITKTVKLSPSSSIAGTTTLDGLGRTIVEQLTDGSYVGYGYDSMGRQCAQSNPTVTAMPTGLSCSASNNQSYIVAGTDGITYSTYDVLGRKTGVANPDATTTEAWQYSGPTVTFTDENANNWKRSIDAAGRLIKVLEPNGTSQSATMETDYSYDPLNDLLSVTQYGGPYGTTGSRVRTFNYDGMSRLLCASNPETSSAACPSSPSTSYVTGTTAYAYDGNGNVVSRTTPAVNAGSGTQTIGYCYDSLNRITYKFYSGTFSCSSPSAYAATYSYDSSSVTGAQNTIGRLTDEKSYAGATLVAERQFYSYDPMGRVLNENQFTLNGFSPSAPYSPAYKYDLAGDFLASTDGKTPIQNPYTTSPCTNPPPSGWSSLTMTYCYDSAGRPSNVTSNWGTYATALFAIGTNGYGPVGPVNWTLGGPNLSVTQGYSNRLQINSILATGQVP